MRRARKGKAASEAEGVPAALPTTSEQARNVLAEFTSPTPEQAMRFWHQVSVLNHVHLSNEWQGYRLAGRDLVAPDGQRVSSERLRGLLWRDAMELRLAGFSSRRKAEQAKQGPKVRVVIVDLQDYRERGLSAA